MGDYEGVVKAFWTPAWMVIAYICGYLVARSQAKRRL